MQSYLFIIFAVIIVGFLILDLAVFNKKAKKVEPRAALVQSLFWIALSLGFGMLIYFAMGKDLATEYLSAYVTEKMLSVDNLFVIMLIFSFFKLEERYHHKVLFWGIIGAIVFRALFIGAGALVIAKFYWILYIFGAILVFTGIKLFADKKEEHVDLNKNKTMILAQKYLPFTTNHHNGKFLVKENGKFLFTSLFMIALLVETTDIVFAFDSIPAAFAISQRPFIVFTSNIFAIMGLRALFFLLEGILHKFHHLQKGLSFILVFIGAKMLLGIIDIHLSSLTSFAVIIIALVGSLLLSVIFPKKI